MQLDELAPNDRPSNDRYTGDVRSVSCAASIMASATPFCFCTTQKHLTVKMAHKRAVQEALTQKFQ